MAQTLINQLWFAKQIHAFLTAAPQRREVEQCLLSAATLSGFDTIAFLLLIRWYVQNTHSNKSNVECSNVLLICAESLHYCFFSCLFLTIDLIVDLRVCFQCQRRPGAVRFYTVPVRDPKHALDTMAWIISTVRIYMCVKQWEWKGLEQRRGQFSLSVRCTKVRFSPSGSSSHGKSGHM